MVRKSSDEGHRRDIRHPVPDDHIVTLFSRSDEQRNLSRVMLSISIDGNCAIITTIHEIPESCLERSTLAHIGLVANNYRTRGTRSPSCIVSRTIVDNHSGGHKWTHPFHDSRNVVFFVEGRNDRSDFHTAVLQKSKKFRNCVGSWSTIASYCCAKSTTKARTHDRSSEASGLIGRPNLSKNLPSGCRTRNPGIPTSFLRKESSAAPRGKRTGCPKKTTSSPPLA